MPMTFPPSSSPNEAPADLQHQPFGRFAAWGVGPVLLITGLALLPFGLEVHRAVKSGLETLPLNDFWNTARQFASTTGILIIFAAIGLLVRAPRRRLALAVVALSLVAGAAINEPAKRLFGRMRPEFSASVDDKNRRNFDRKVAQRYSQYDFKADGTMQWLLPRGLDRPFFFDAYSSFPSGHSCASGALVVALAACFPRGRWLWLVLGAGCALSRVRHDRHFIEDCLVGFSIGWMAGHLVVAWVRMRVARHHELAKETGPVSLKT
jgi:membrane-associated phospholipid phosphatase